MDPQTSSLTPPSSKRARLETDGEDCIVLEDKEDCYIVKSSEPNRELAEVKNRQGRTVYSSGQFTNARSLYNEAIQLDPHNPIYYANRAAANMSLGEPDSVLADLDRAIQLDPSYLKAYSRKFNHLLSLGEFVKAEQIVEQIKRCGRNAAEIENEVSKMNVERIGTVKYNQGLYEKAVSKGDYREALHYIETILVTCAHSRDMKLRKAEALAYLLRHEEVINIVDTILRKDGTNSEALFVRGLSLYLQDNVEKAKAHFQKALRFEPEHRKSIEFLKKAKLFQSLKEEGKNAVRNGELAKAIELFQKALGVDGNNKLANAKVHFNLSVVYKRQNKRKEALYECDRAIELDPNYDKAYMKRAILHEELENYKASADDYELLYARLKTRELKIAYERAKLMSIRTKNEKNYYKILGVAKEASEKEIRKAYRQKAMEFHPDRHPEANEKQKADQERKFKDVGEAYTCLSDPTKRKSYNDKGEVCLGDSSSVFNMFGPEVFRMYGCDPSVVDEVYNWRP